MESNFLPAAARPSENAALILPASWTNNNNIPARYTEMAQQFLTKMAQGDVERFDNDKREQKNFGRLFGQLAYEALEFYGNDFAPIAYPDFAVEAARHSEPARKAVVTMAAAIFAEFGHAMPASFYWLQLAPAQRETVTSRHALRTHAADKFFARAWDAALHAEKVFGIQMTLQSIASEFGYVRSHCRDCNCALEPSSARFHYRLPADQREETIEAYLWHLWYEYAIYPLMPMESPRLA